LAVSQKRAALVGLGRSGGLFLELLAELPELDLVGVIDANAGRLAPASRPELPTATSIDPLLLPRRVPDVAVVCAPPAAHAAIVEPLLHAGTDCLVEGPLGASGREADQLSEKAERLGRTLVTVAPFRYSPAVDAVRAALAAGLVGRLVHLEVTLGCKRDVREALRAEPALAPDGVWADLGAHALDLAESIAGATDRIRMVEAGAQQQGELADEVTVETLHARGLHARISLSWNREPSEPLACCVGSDGDLAIGLAQTRLRTREGERRVGPGYDPRAAARAALADFLRARLDPDAFDDDGPLLSHWLEAALRSRKSRRWEIC
jgi:predicted dehydrogenase